MHILFIDESGTPPANAQVNQRHFVLGGLIVPVGEWHTVHNKLHTIKTRYGLRGELKWRFFAPNNNDAANPMREMRYEQRDAVRSEILRLIPSVLSLRIIASITSIPAVFDDSSIEGSDDVYRLTYKTLVECFQGYLKDLSRMTGSGQPGIVVSDHRSAEDDRSLRAHHQELIVGPDVFTSTCSNLIETLFLAPSHMSTGIQLADMVAGSVWRKFERTDTRCYDIIEPAVRRSRLGAVDGFGLVKVPGRYGGRPKWDAGRGRSPDVHCDALPAALIVLI